MMPDAEPGPFHIRDYQGWAGGWDLDTQLPRQASRAPLPPVPLLPDAAWARRPGDHDWSGPGGACADCPAPSFLDATGPCTWTGPAPWRECPDQGRCWHDCEPGACFRVHCASPLSAAGWGDQWPADVKAAYRPGGHL